VDVDAVGPACLVTIGDNQCRHVQYGERNRREHVSTPGGRWSKFDSSRRVGPLNGNKSAF
jgi:hypothetical protein